MDVSSKRQNFFKPITLPAERDAIIEAAVRARTEMQLKEEGNKLQRELTLARSYSTVGSTLMAVHVSGPKLQTMNAVTISFGVNKSLYFCVASLTTAPGADYALEIMSFYELQRRDAFRVIIQPALITAYFTTTNLIGMPEEVAFRVQDLSAGGAGIAITKKLSPFLKTGMEVSGMLSVGNNPPINVKLLVRFIRPLVDSPEPLHAGCQFADITTATSEKIAFIVNDCHRIAFSRINK